MRYRIAILGCGHIGKKHAVLAAHYGHLVAVADIIAEKAQELANHWNLPAYSTLTELLQQEKPDLVVICTPNGYHAEHSIEALKAGAHVLCEKPMAITLAEAEAMKETATLHNKRLFVVKQNRFNPPVQWLKELLEQGKLGRLLGFQLNAFWNRDAAYFQQSGWRGTLILDGGPLFTQFSHFIDLLYWYLGDLKTVHYAHGENRFHLDSIEFEDQGIAVLEFEHGVQGTVQYTINAHTQNMEGSILLFGEKGTVKLGGTYLNKLEYVQIEGVQWPDLPASPPTNQYGFYEGSSSQHHLVYEAILQALKDPSYRFLEPWEALQTVSIIESIYGKMRKPSSCHG